MAFSSNWLIFLYCLWQIAYLNPLANDTRLAVFCDNFGPLLPAFVFKPLPTFGIWPYCVSLLLPKLRRPRDESAPIFKIVFMLLSNKLKHAFCARLVIG